MTPVGLEWPIGLLKALWEGWDAIEMLECIELTADKGTAESICVRIEGQKDAAGVIVGVYHRPLSLGNDSD